MRDNDSVKVVTTFLESQKDGVTEAVKHLADDIMWCAQRPRYSFSGGRLADLLSMGPLRGKQEVRDFLQLISDEIEYEDGRITEVIAEGDKVVVLTQGKFWVKATGKGSEMSSVIIFTVRDGKISEVRAFDDTAAVQDALTPAP
jgi:ketosteroid isomerase-like protein